MNTATSTWDLPIEEFFQVDEQKQLQYAFRTFLKNTKSPSFDDDQSDDDDDDDEDLQVFFHSKLQLFQLFIRTQTLNIRQLSAAHHERVLVERLFYLVLNNVELTNFASFNINSIINLSKELEKYQSSTKKIITNTNKLNTIVQFVLSFSPSTISAFRLNNLFYLLLNDMNDFSGKIIDRMAEVLRVYHFMTYGHSISKQYLISTIDHAIHTANYANPILYPFYENFLNSSYIYKGPFRISSSSSSEKCSAKISLFTMIQNLAIVLLGLHVDDFECEDRFLAMTSEQCYHIRLVIRRLTYTFFKSHYLIEYPLNHIDKQIVLFLIRLILVHGKTSETIRHLLDLYMITIRGFSETKIKRLFYDLLVKNSFDFYSIETIRYFLELNRLHDEDHSETNSNLSQEHLPHFAEDDTWLHDDQIRLVTHRFYSKEIYQEIFLPLINGDWQGKRTMDELLTYLDQIPSEQDRVIDVQEIKEKLNLSP